MRERATPKKKARCPTGKWGRTYRVQRVGDLELSLEQRGRRTGDQRHDDELDLCAYRKMSTWCAEIEYKTLAGRTIYSENTPGAREPPKAKHDVRGSSHDRLLSGLRPLEAIELTRALSEYLRVLVYCRRHCSDEVSWHTFLSESDEDEGVKRAHLWGSRHHRGARRMS